jgi:hypothetical protein
MVWLKISKKLRATGRGLFSSGSFLRFQRMPSGILRRHSIVLTRLRIFRASVSGQISKYIRQKTNKSHISKFNKVCRHFSVICCGNRTCCYFTIRNFMFYRLFYYSLLKRKSIIVTRLIPSKSSPKTVFIRRYFV